MFLVSYVSCCSSDQMQSLIDSLANVEFSKDNLNQQLKEFAEVNQLKFAVLMKTLRSALSGLKASLGLLKYIIM